MDQQAAWIIFSFTIRLYYIGSGVSRDSGDFCKAEPAFWNLRLPFGYCLALCTFISLCLGEVWTVQIRAGEAERHLSAGRLILETLLGPQVPFQEQSGEKFIRSLPQYSDWRTRGRSRKRWAFRARPVKS